jgi:hypothetical protein
MEKSTSSIFQNENGRVVKLFCAVGLNEQKLTKYIDEEENIKYVQNIDVLKKNMKLNLDKLEYDNEKW